jgi:hypothetical protein
MAKVVSMAGDIQAKVLAMTMDQISEAYRICIVDWLDAADQEEIDLHEVGNVRQHCVRRLSLGWLVRSNSTGVVIMTDIDEKRKCEITAIPIDFVNSIKILDVIPELKGPDDVDPDKCGAEGL